MLHAGKRPARTLPIEVLNESSEPIMSLPDGHHQALRAEFCRRLLPAYLTQMDRASAEGALQAAMTLELHRLQDDDFAVAFAASIGVGSPADYLPRVIDVNETPLLCGIRFFGGDRSLAFVDLIAGDSIVEDGADAALAAMRAYSMFEPARARILMPGSQAPRVRADWCVEADQVFAMAPAAVIATMPSARPEVVDLVPAAQDEAAAFVLTGYSRVAAADPALGSRLFPATAGDLGACHAHGHLWWWTIQGERAGLIAARHDEVLGVKGLLIVEEVVAPSFAGRGTAALAQRELARRACESSPGAMLVGTIDAANTPSRITAKRAGRAEVASWLFVGPGAGRGV
jgi:hypothetical protein